MLSVEGLEKAFTNSAGAVVAGVHGVDFTLAPGEFFTLLGPSGCGKTTTLRCVAGLETPTGGTIAIDGRPVYDAARRIDVPLQERRIGMVFQSYAVWPHMSVFQNAAYPLRYGADSRVPRSEVRARVMTVLEQVGLADLAERPAPKLSGGQQQRLALARALVARPQLLLLDEPLSNLDAALRDLMRREIRRMQKETGVTALYVTHDQAEALSMSDRIAVMNAGRIEQLADPLSIYHAPATRFVATFIGLSNVVDCTVRGTEADGRVIVDSALGTLHATRSGATAASGNVLVIRPEAFDLVPATDAAANVTADNVLGGQVVARAFVGEVCEYTVEVAGVPLTFRQREADIPIGSTVHLALPRERVKVL